MLCDPAARDSVAAAGEDPDVLVDDYVAAVAGAIEGAPATVTTAMHLCRGNYKGHWMASGGYEPVAEKVFGHSGVEMLFLEFDSDRSGDFAPLRHVPSTTTVVLGLVSSKTPVLEIARRPVAPHRRGLAAGGGRPVGPLAAMRVRVDHRRQPAHRRRREAQARADRRGLSGGMGIRMTSKTEHMTTTDHDVALEQLYADFAANGLKPLWTVRGDLMPTAPSPRRRAPAVALARRAPDRRACRRPRARGSRRRAARHRVRELRPAPRALRDPDPLGCRAVPRPEEVAPAHRHSQSAFRFVLEGEGVWTIVDGDPVAMRRGDLLLTAGWRWHEHHNVAPAPMVWLDGLDIPLVSGLDAGFFEFGPDEVSDRVHALVVSQRAPVGSPRPPPGRRPWSRPRRSWPIGGSTPTPPWPHSSSSRPKAVTESWLPATPRSVSPTRPTGPTPRDDPARDAQARRGPSSALPRTRGFVGVAGVRGRWRRRARRSGPRGRRRATSSWCRPGA